MGGHNVTHSSPLPLCLCIKAFLCVAEALYVLLWTSTVCEHEEILSQAAVGWLTTPQFDCYNVRDYVAMFCGVDWHSCLSPQVT